MLNVSVNSRTGEATLANLFPLRAGAPGPATLSATPIWDLRTEEQPYAFLPQTELPERNRYGQQIDLLAHAEGKLPASLPANRSLHINGNPAVGSNPNRNKQHGFYFTSDNCIGCHACEAACSEKNNNPPHLAYRSVGYVEGGSFPDYKRMNISMACNHCDDPVCLKGCPTAAYTKHAEYGAVLQDPETCFGCGYCTWVCPYNAPQLDPVKGQVSKCNMCVDRLEVGLKPACVAACVGNALDFGVIEVVPAGREQARVEIPGFPSPEITHPNIRFQQIKQLPDEMTRTDSMPVKYHRDEAGRYQPVIDKTKGAGKGAGKSAAGRTQTHWNLARLSSRENPLVIFTLAAQAAAGAFALQFLGALIGLPGFTAFAQSAGYAPLALLALALVAVGLFMSTLHLGKPKRFYRGFNNLRHSPVSREGLGIAIFQAMLGLHVLFSLPANPWLQAILVRLDVPALTALAAPGRSLSALANATGLLAVAASGAGLYYMTRCYRIRARPFWNHWQVGTACFGSALSLGAILAAAVMLPTLALGGQSVAAVLALCTGALALGLSVEAVGLRAHAVAMAAAQNEGGASHHVQTTTFGKTYLLRNALLGACLLAATALLITLVLNGGAADSTRINLAIVAFTLIAVISVGLALVSRALFYVLVIPTTMPGAFFWKNKRFEDHARDIGLAHLPQVGVAPLRH